MPLLIVITSMLAITGIVWLLNKILPFKVCPICAGISGTWLVLTAGILFDRILIDDFGLLIVLLMGGTVVGIAYQGEQTILWATSHPLTWKVIVIGTGFSLAYLAFLTISLTTLVIEIIFMAALTYIFFIKPSIKIKYQIKNTAEPSLIRKLEEKLKKCC